MQRHKDTCRAPVRPAAGQTALLLIDNGPIRERAVVEVRKAMRALDKAQSEMRVFEEGDKPLYQRWYHATFAADLARLRDLEERSADLCRRIEEIRRLKKAYRLDSHGAWLMAEELREHPDLCGPWDGGIGGDGEADPYGARADLFGETDDGDSAGRIRDCADGDGCADEEAELLSEEEIRDLFVRFLSRTTTLDPFSLEESVHDRLLSEFKRDVLGLDVPDPEGPPEEPEAASPAELKRLYRLLVRRLHPDFNPAPTERLRDAWNRVQAAYRDGDLRELELIGALCDVDCGGITDLSSVSRLEAMRDECRERTGLLLGELAEAREDPAWGFSRAARPPRALVHSIQEELGLALGRASIGLAALERRLRRYAEPPGSRCRRREEEPGQLRLPFDLSAS